MPSVLILDDNGEILYLNENQSTEETLRMLGRGTAPAQPDSSDQLVDILKTKGVAYVAVDFHKPIKHPILSPRETEVLICIANALSPEQTAIKLGIKVRTVRKHIYGLMRKLSARSRDQLMARAGYLKLCNPYQ
jgi:DNA-binding CsgD family transcriptional regulator